MSVPGYSGGGGAAAGVSSFNTRQGAVILGKADVTATGLASGDVGAVPTTAEGAVNGVATLDGTGNVPGVQLGNAGGIAVVPTVNVAASEATTNGAYVDLFTAGPSVTITVKASGILVVFFGAIVNAVGVSTFADMSIALSGANVQAASDTNAVSFSPNSSGILVEQSRAVLFTGLTAGATTVTAKYKSSDATSSCTFRNRWLFALVA